MVPMKPTWRSGVTGLKISSKEEEIDDEDEDVSRDTVSPGNRVEEESLQLRNSPRGF